MRIGFLNPQGNFDAKDRYWTEHPDFGGQLVYVKEVAIAMAQLGVEVVIFTRKINDPIWNGFEAEQDFYPGVKNLNIVRIPFGGEHFLRKEELWPHLAKFAGGIINYYQQESIMPDIFTAHYADGGLTGVILQQKLGIPFTFTAHSLGAQKMDKLRVEPSNIAEFEVKYHFSKRISAERNSIRNSAVNIVSSKQERYEQYAHRLYEDIIDVRDDQRFSIISPGVNTNIFFSDQENEDQKLIEKINSAFKRDLSRERLQLPCIIASSRLERKKNHLGLIKAFASSDKLQEMANLCIIIRGVENPLVSFSNLGDNEKIVMTDIIHLIDLNGLRGKIAFLNLMSQQELAGCYRYLSRSGGVFALTALYEPFGLAPLEAAACSLPVLVTRNGGPSEIFKDEKEEYGLLIDPESEGDIAQGLLYLIADHFSWQRFARAGYLRVKNKFTWRETAKSYLRVINRILDLDQVQLHQQIDELDLQKLKKFYIAKGDNYDNHPD